jgi:hypothetical protein
MTVSVELWAIDYSYHCYCHHLYSNLQFTLKILGPYFKLAKAVKRVNSYLTQYTIYIY